MSSSWPTTWDTFVLTILNAISSSPMISNLSNRGPVAISNDKISVFALMLLRKSPHLYLFWSLKALWIRSTMGLQWRMRPFVTGGFTQQKIYKYFSLRTRKKITKSAVRYTLRTFSPYWGHNRPPELGLPSGAGSSWLGESWSSLSAAAPDLLGPECNKNVDIFLKSGLTNYLTCLKAGRHLKAEGQLVDARCQSSDLPIGQDARVVRVDLVEHIRHVELLLSAHEEVEV